MAKNQDKDKDAGEIAAGHAEAARSRQAELERGAGGRTSDDAARERAIQEMRERRAREEASLQAASKETGPVSKAAAAGDRAVAALQAQEPHQRLAQPERDAIERAARMKAWEEAWIGTRFIVRTTHGGAFRKGGISFTPDPKEIVVAEESLPDHGVLGMEFVHELLEAARPPFVLPEGRAGAVAGAAGVPSGRVLAVEDAATRRPVYPDRDMEAIRAGKLPRRTPPGEAEVEPAVAYVNAQREAGLLDSDDDDR